jgi:glycosyltransferase involved in cell wall biosynthesis
MRVIQAADYGPPFPGSFVPMLRAVLGATRERGWQPVALLPERARDHDWVAGLREQGFRVEIAPGVERGDLGPFLERVVAEDDGPTVVHTHFTAFDLAAAAAVRRRPRATAYWHLHTVLGQGAAVRLRNQLKFRLLSRPVERVICVSSDLAADVRARGAPRSKLEALPNGVDVEAFHPPSAAERAEARRASGLPEDATVLLHFGRDWQIKGGDLFLEAFAELLRDRPNLVAACVRGGEPARREAARLGIERSVAVLDGTPDIWRLHAAADLFMATSRGEGAGQMPLAVLEALACGRGVVATDLAGGGGEARPQLAGLRIVPLDAAGIAAGARALLERDAAGAASAAEEGREWVARNLGVQRWAGRLIEMYERSRLRLAP